MGNEANWNTFTQTGKVSDYLAYVREEKGRNGWENAAKDLPPHNNPDCAFR